MKHLFFYLLVFISISEYTLAQEYFSEGKKRLNFAKTYLEVGGHFTPSFMGKEMNGVVVQNISNSSAIVPNLNIGGIHFWGHADFYISIPLTQINLNKSHNTQYQFNQSVVTGARFLPWAVKDNRIRPFIGASWAVVNFKQNEDLPIHSMNKLVFDAGVLYAKGSLMARAGVNLYPTSVWNYPLAKNSSHTIHTPIWGAYFGLIYAFETTRSKNMDKENERVNQYPAISKPSLDAKKTGDWFFGIGPSTSFMLEKSVYNDTYYPYLNDKPISNSFLDLSIGYQFNKLGLVTSISYRNPKFKNNAFDVKQELSKNSIAIEAFKFLTDYSGFTPYIGLNIAFDNITYMELSNTSDFSQSNNEINPGITFGWDILPGKTEQWFVLRTNLRWYPLSKIEVNGKEFSQNQLEYNVIQAVFYPSRYKNSKSKKNK